MKKIIFCLLIFTGLSCSNSTVYSGHVFDENRNALPEVKVQVVGSDIYTITDENGFFNIDPKERGDEILIVKPGYEMQYYSLKSQSEDIELTLKVKEDK